MTGQQLLKRPDDSDIIRMWTLSVRTFNALGECRTYLDDDRDLAALMRRAREGFGCLDWSVWLDAPHALGQLRFHAVGIQWRTYMITQSVREP